MRLLIIGRVILGLSLLGAGLLAAEPAAAQTTLCGPDRCSTDLLLGPGRSPGRQRMETPRHDGWDDDGRREPDGRFGHEADFPGLPLPPPTEAPRAGFGYRCASPPGYYPYVTTCRRRWQTVPRRR